MTYKEETEIEYVEVEYEELPPAHIIEPLDSVKVKQVFDDSTMEAIQSAGYIANYYWDNIKLFFMFISCIFALIAQFYPQSFPGNNYYYI
jgi:signal peptidase complex subunit 2